MKASIGIDEWVDVGCWDINIHADHAYLYVTAYELSVDADGRTVTDSTSVAWQVTKPLPNKEEDWPANNVEETK